MKEEKIKRVAYYIQIDNNNIIESSSFESQNRILTNWIKETNGKWVKTYQDNIDGKKEKFLEMLEDAKNRVFDCIYIFDNNTISNSAKDLLNLIDKLLAHNIILYIYNLKHIDLYSEKGRFLLENFDTFSNFFNKKLSLKVQAGIKQKIKKKEWFGQAPYGYTIVSDKMEKRRKKNTKLAINQNEESVLKEMKELRNKGLSYNEIALTLNQKRILPRNKKSHWYATTVRNILYRKPVDPVYCIQNKS